MNRGIHTTLVFVCTGNIGRSPLAAALAEQRLARELGVDRLRDAGVEIVSAGTKAPPHVRASKTGTAVGDEVGVDLRGHRSRRVTKKLAQAATQFYCMDGEQVDELTAKFAELVGKIHILRSDGRPIPDPRGKDIAFYRVVREQIRQALEDRLPEIVGLIGDQPSGPQAPTTTDGAHESEE